MDLGSGRKFSEAGTLKDLCVGGGVGWGAESEEGLEAVSGRPWDREGRMKSAPTVSVCVFPSLSLSYGESLLRDTPNMYNPDSLILIPSLSVMEGREHGAKETSRKAEASPAWFPFPTLRSSLHRVGGTTPWAV